MRITLCGAAGEVTGSAYLVETERACVLVDLGLYQGHRSDDLRNADLRPIDPSRLDAIVLTHAHLDHTGRLPLAATRGFRGPIYCTLATIDFTRLILLDSAHIQESEAQRRSRRLERAGRPPQKPLYTQSDVERLVPLFRATPFHESREVAPGVVVRLINSGHMLGSASVEMTVTEKNVTRVVIFSGDVGHRNWPILRDPETFAHGDVVFLESTYGNRDHRPLDATVEEFKDVLSESISAGEKVLIPSFAIGRAQQMLWHIAELVRSKRVPAFPVYLDSPMAQQANEIYLRHRLDLDDEAQRLTAGTSFNHDLPLLHITATAEESAALNHARGAAVIIAGSGMCNAGRILHHLKHNLWRPNVAVLMVGYMAQGTLGRQLISGAKMVRIHGQAVAVRATIRTLGGFSGHAGQSELLDWLRPLAAGRPRVVLTHGEAEQRQALQAKIREQFGLEAMCPMFNQVVSVDAE